ncbi:kinase-like domain-containing protein [Scenedesmus sp. NREL 46B-D3]|nr:kinase-like domain-containing protein [Scenedesmus sp. NREL 46B-D3]
MELRDGELESTLRLACKVFDVETATVSLLTGERIYLVGACGALPVCVCPDRWGFCGWSFLNPNHELNVVENMLEDARFSENFFVVSENFRLVFYVMAPLISSNGHRIGTLCIMGQQPRKFDATRGAILANLSELLVRQIERRWALQGSQRVQGSKLLRSVEAYESACGFIDATNVNNWRLLHLNAPAVELLGIEWTASYDELPKLDEGRRIAAFDGIPLEQVLGVDMSLAAWQAAQAELTLTNVKGAKGTAAEGKSFNVTFKLAASDALDEHAPFSVGVPSWLRESSDPGPGHNYFFMHIRPADASPARQPALLHSSGLQLGPRLTGPSPIPNLVLGPLLGKGGFGKVYRGVHEGTEVAVKIIEKLESVRVMRQGIPIEVAMTQNFHHLGVLRSIAWGIGQPDPAVAQMSPALAKPTCWIVSEYCDKHTLVDAVVKGWFRTSRQPTQGGTHLRCVVLTAYEVASALAYIHSQGIMHLDLTGDLTGGNVLLTSFAGNPHGFSARVTDFGLARPQDVRVRSAPGRYGTVTHMAPETIRAGVLDYPCDAYGFGVLFWEMITGSRAWAGLAHDDVLAQVGGDGQLELPQGLPPVLEQLVASCLSKEPTERPTFKQMLPRLEAYLQCTRSCTLEEVTLPLRSTAALE